MAGAAAGRVSSDSGFVEVEEHHLPMNINDQVELVSRAEIKELRRIKKMWDEKYGDKSMGELCKTRNRCT